MTFMKWNESLSVHVKLIDKQHKELIDLVNKAHEVDFESDKKKGGEILNRLVEFTRVHFSTEEKYFERCDFEGAEEHIKEHANLIEEVLIYQSELNSGKVNWNNFLKFLKGWIENHLKTMDRKYIKTFQRCGLK